MSIASRTSGPGRPGDPMPGVVMRRVEGEARVRAAARLVNDAGRHGPDAGRSFLAMAAKYGIDVSNLWASEDEADGRIRHACLATVGAGRTLNFFVSTPENEAEERELGGLIERAIRSAMDTAGSSRPVLAQTLLDPSQDAARRAFALAGFEAIASLSYMEGSLPRREPTPPGPALPEGVTIEAWRAGGEREFVEALDRTYVDTLDCPELCHLRDTEDVLASHLATGEHDPDLWWLIRFNGRPEGALLLNPCPPQGQIELVYLGLGPSLRGRGVAREMLRHAIRVAASRRRERILVCAVDHRNAPALRLYRSFGFREFATRVALVRSLGPQTG